MKIFRYAACRFVSLLSEDDAFSTMTPVLLDLSSLAGFKELMRWVCVSAAFPDFFEHVVEDRPSVVMEGVCK